MNPRFPVYIISKGRWESRLTSKALEKMRVPYRIVVEPQEFSFYASVIDPAKILTLPFSNLGQGSIPARNWCWEHSINEGAERHPDCVKIRWKWGRYQHQVDYRPFRKNKLIRRKDIEIPNGINEYGMKLIQNS